LIRFACFLIGTIACSFALSPPAFPAGMNPLHGKPAFHLVEKGEFLYKIAARYNCGFPALSRANGLRNPNEVRAGMKLTLPLLMILPGRENGETTVVNLPEFRLYHFRSEKEVRVYPICIGLTTWQTPRGQFEIANKVMNPTWYMNREMADKLHVSREVVSPGPLNPLGDRWIGTSLEHIGFHSTNQPMSIGRALSHGCMRLYPDSAMEFFDSTRVKEKGRIIYEPVKVTVWQDEIYLEVHDDVYDVTKDYKREFSARADSLQIDPGSLNRVLLEKTLLEKRGLPTVIGKIQKRGPSQN
jgi:L,D-transpeptidase ErfK/SrfK